MKLSVPNTLKFIWLFMVFAIMIRPSVSDPRLSVARVTCGNRNQTSPGMTLNFNKAMETLDQRISDKNFYGTSYVTSPYPPLFSLYQCHEDLSSSDCLQCFNESKTRLLDCHLADSGRVYLDGCFLRYDDHDFFRDFVDPIGDEFICSNTSRGSEVEEYILEGFHIKLDRILSETSQKAVGELGFGAGELKGVVNIYALAQCWQTLDMNGCRECLWKAKSRLRTCGAEKEGRATFTGCYMRYSTEKFFEDGSETVNVEGSDRKEIIRIASLGVLIFTLSGFGAYMGYKRLSRTKRDSTGTARKPDQGVKRSLNFKYETLEKATGFFDSTMKLGEGGNGSVFKGVLPNGETVAVKKLFFNTRQWVDQFFNEVNLISGIQHQNVVKLLGCSIEGPESLLVYEYVPHRSLDRIIFVKNTVHILSWQQRFDIISGVAEGLAYLHAGCGVKIIHRDIKTSNILLDNELTPKISDFGLARCVGSDKSHLSTGIAGTLGYMAPEYLVRGQLTEKADIYAFGVLILEVATGRKNSVFSHGSSSILYLAWKHYMENSITRSIDPELEHSFNEKEAAKVLQIGLLCTQSSVELRPSMSEVVQMLKDPHCIVPSPQQPPFLNASVLCPDENSTTYNIMKCPVSFKTKTLKGSDHESIVAVEP